MSFFLAQTTSSMSKSTSSSDNDDIDMEILSNPMNPWTISTKAIKEKDNQPVEEFRSPPNKKRKPIQSMGSSPSKTCQDLIDMISSNTGITTSIK